MSQAQKAKFGFRDQTCFDDNVRDTYEIAADQLDVDISTNMLGKMMSDMRAKLSLPPHIELEPHLHNLLIYGPGQFFKPHQDSEKLPNMVGTLVVVLPSPHIGGDLIVTHKNNQYRLATENIDSEQCHCVAFYADCQHEITPVRHGYRVALTYHLVANTDDSKQAVMNDRNPDLKKALQQYFDSDKPDDQSPDVFAYFLDHEYSEHGLNWNLLKGIDYYNAHALRQTGDQLGLIPHLALVDIYETWATEWDEPEPIDYIDGAVSLNFWLDRANRQLPYAKYVLGEHQFCCSKPTKAFEPTDSEFEGWMGNHGNTIDYWYRRAAVVLWPKEDDIKMQFMLDYEGAIEQLMALVSESDNQSKIETILQLAGDKIYPSYHQKTPERLNDLMLLADYIKHSAMAVSLLAPFEIKLLKYYSMKYFKMLESRYGTQWCWQLLKTWAKSPRQQPLLNYACHLKNIDKIVEQAIIENLDEALIHFIVDYQFNCLVETDKHLANSSPEIRYGKDDLLLLYSRSLLKACLLDPGLQDTAKSLVDHLISISSVYPLPLLAQLYFSIIEQVDIAHFDAVDHPVKQLRHHLVKHINQELRAGLKDPSDWSINITLNCDCQYCRIATDFLRSSTECEIVWPIAQRHRYHISSMLSTNKLPVDISTIKQGSPHKLVLVKTERLHQDAKGLRP
jgi:predicted 2-oxoglutarate/Fe(II)-dependent dioxygenase YbiX